MLAVGDARRIGWGPPDSCDTLFTYKLVSDHTLHARSISTDTGWKISLDRGLDIFQRFDGGLLSIQSASQEARYCKAFEITYIRTDV